MDNWNIQAAPFVDPHTVPNGFSSNGQHSWVMTDKDDPASWRHCGLDHADDVGDGQAGEQGPHGEVLETGGRRRELIAQGVVLHVDTNKIVQAWSREAQNSRDLFSVEKIGSLVPVNPHATQVISQ